MSIRERSGALLGVAVLVLACALLALKSNRAPAPTRAPASGTLTAGSPVRAGEPRGRLTVAARRSAVGFARSYLAYAYHDRAVIVDATPGLRRRLLAHTPRVWAASAERHPRVLSLSAVPAGTGRLIVRVRVGDGLLRYPLDLRIAGGSSGRPLVAGIEGARG